MFRLNILILGLILLTAGCVKSPPGSVSEIVGITGPTFGGVRDKNFTTPSMAFTLSGECHPASTGMEFSYNGTAWTTHPAGCVNKTFSIPVNVVGSLHVYVRSRKLSAVTKSAHAFIRLIIPATSPSVQMVISGAADQDVQRGTQNAVETTFTKVPMDGGTVKIKPSLIDSIYE